MKHIISLIFSGNGAFEEEVIDFLGESIRVSQYQLNFDFNLAKSIIKDYDGIVDAFALSGVPPVISMKGGGFIHPQIEKIKKVAKMTPMMDGNLLKRNFLPFALRKFSLEHHRFFEGKKVSFYAGAFHYPLIDEITNAGAQVVLGDPLFFLKQPFTLGHKKHLDTFIKTMRPLFKRMKLKRSHLGNFSKRSDKIPQFFKSDIFVGNDSTFDLVDQGHLKDKIVFIDFLSESREKQFKAAGVKGAVVCMPNILKANFSTFSLVEACLQVTQTDVEYLNEMAILKWMEKNTLKAHYCDFGPRADEIEKFAFIIHPLSKKHLFRHKLLKPLTGFSDSLGPVVEEAISQFPGFYHGKIGGIVSEKNGKEVEGLIYTMTETPKKLLEKDVNSIYGRLIKLCDEGASQGARIIGLGAYTKIVGDAGVTVADQSPIPVTTGNSLSACATLWAAKFALDKMNFVVKKNERYQGKVMIIGATGSIGAVSAKILAKSWSEVVIVAPRAYKLLELKEEIEAIDSDVRVYSSTNPEEYIRECDLIITSTSAQGRKILEIDQVKPGAIICDVSRPFDISEEDALSRPDVMVIASGEVMLPGPVDMRVDLGLKGNIVYACLAETALLAMEGKYENFTLSRNINYEKVLEVDRLCQEHGVRLSCIMGHNGFITDEEFELCREHALKKKGS
ncbi:MAG: hypothetical protein VXV96_06060 [Bdellovibrionota bacterium]|nr:hypothetical protein [Bdellovibrionota bacterium]